MEEDGADTDEGPPPSKTDSRDGLINFAPYSLEQLRELQYSIDRHAFPENFRNLLEALRQKEEPIAQGLPPSDAYVGRFSSRTGLLGWLQAKFRRSPVYGFGFIEVGTSQVTLSGWQRTWLGAPVESQVTLALGAVRNVVQEGTWVCFEVTQKYRWFVRIHFQPESSEHVKQLLEELPGLKTPRFLKHWSAIRDFNQRLQTVSGRPWVTPLIVALNAIVFAAMVVTTKKLGQFNAPELLVWGANFGPLTVNGQWWRLFTALFVHFSLLHVALNMWAFWNIGRLSERLFGHGTLLYLYVAAGIIASLASVAWDPSLGSVGASGAIFGIFGAFLAFLSRQRHQIPPTIVRQHWISTSAFVVFNLVSGAIQPGIDNAAHAGGLLSGFVLGYVLARPLDRKIRKRFPVNQGLTSAAIIAMVTVAAIWQVRGIGSELTAPEKFFRGHAGYVSGETQNLQLWNTLAQRAAAGNISDAELSRQFERDILPFWQEQKDRLEKENETLKGTARPYALLVAEFVTLRYEWASAIIYATKNHDSGRLAEAQELMSKTIAVNAKLDRIGIRSRMDLRSRALANNLLATKIRQLFTGYRCVGEPPGYGPPIADSDDKNDGPAARHALGCRAQQLFMSGDYERLDSLMNQYMGTLEDLPDGSSRYEGLVAGLADLFEFGGVDADIVLGHMADWRRRVKNPTMADLAEAMFFSEWAWWARGHDVANAVTSQNMALYAYRTEMAVAALDDAADRASNNPLWYTLSLEVGLDQSKDREKLQELFDRGLARTRQYRPLYRRMLRILMPRWGGSYDAVDKFINRIHAQTADSRGYERYAELYSVYARMEGDEVDLFSETHAYWSGMRAGYLGLIKRYPTSDGVLNSFAYFACRAGDKDEYNRLRDTIGKRLSATAWTAKYSIEACDKKLALTSGFSGSPPLEALTGDLVRSFGGVRLGMTGKELVAAKGQPIRQDETNWVYNTMDSKHNGVIAVGFSPSRENSEGVVRAIEYTGDEASAPSELPYLNDWSSVAVIEKYGAQISGSLTLTGEMTFTFPNGVYVNTHDEKVYRYGIVTVP
jgi:membrane associated rhomboid family serine protease